MKVYFPCELKVTTVFHGSSSSSSFSGYLILLSFSCQSCIYLWNWHLVQALKPQLLAVYELTEWPSSLMESDKLLWHLDCKLVSAPKYMYRFLRACSCDVFPQSRSISDAKIFVSDLFLVSGYSIPRSLSDDYLVWIGCLYIVLACLLETWGQ